MCSLRFSRKLSVTESDKIILVIYAVIWKYLNESAQWGKNGDGLNVATTTSSFIRPNQWRFGADDLEISFGKSTGLIGNTDINSRTKFNNFRNRAPTNRPITITSPILTCIQHGNDWTMQLICCVLLFNAELAKRAKFREWKWKRNKICIRLIRCALKYQFFID